jgi:CheY-like chemotaxis protein
VSIGEQSGTWSWPWPTETWPYNYPMGTALEGEGEQIAEAPLILVVDDDLDDREAIAELLEQAGYRVDRAVDATDALSLAGLRPPDLVTVDLHMPNIDGYEIARRLRTDVGLKVPIIAVTGRTPPTLQGAFDEVFFKPLTGPTFLKYIRRRVPLPTHD